MITKITGKISSLFVLICFLMIPQIQAERGVKVGEKKTALVIGNADYKVGRLANPLNIARRRACAGRFGAATFRRTGTTT